MKTYIIFAIPTLIVLSVILVWLLLQPKPTRTETTIPTAEMNTPIATTPVQVSDTAHTEESTNLKESEITEAKNKEATILRNAEETIYQTDSQLVTDETVSAYISDNLSPKASEWLVKDHVLSKIARAINALEEGKLVSKYRPLSMPQQTFRADKQDGQLQISQTNYARYTPFISTLEVIGETALIKAFNHYYPELEQAYNALGTEKGSFRTVTKNAIQKLMDSPTPSTTPLLNHKTVMYKYKDPELEKLPAAHKLMIRMGPENSKRLKTLLKKIASKL